MKEMIANALGRDITPKEAKFLDWLAGWDQETVETAEGLFSALFKAGQADANAAHEALERGSAR